MIANEPGVRVLVDPNLILCGRVMLDIVVDFISRLRPMHDDAIKRENIEVYPTLS